MRNITINSFIEKSVKDNNSKKSIIISNIKKRIKLSNEDYEEIEDLLDDILDSNGEINNEGFVTCYYALSKYNKKSYKKDGTVSGGSDKIMLSTKNSKNLKKYGEDILTLSIPIEKLYFSANPSKDELLVKIPFKSSYRRMNIKRYIKKNVK